MPARENSKNVNDLLTTLRVAKSNHYDYDYDSNPRGVLRSPREPKVPLSAVTSVDAGRSNALYTGKPLNIHLGEWGTVVAVVKAAKANDKFRSGVFATSKNGDFASQIDGARQKLN